MKYFGVNHQRKENVIRVSPQQYQQKNIFIESDWSAASYYYEMAAFAEDVDLELNGLSKNSFQGDSVIAEFMKSFGVETDFGPNGSGEKIYLKKNPVHVSPQLHFHLNSFPDLAPALIVTAAGLSQKISFSGVEHLAYKESNRAEVLRNELARCGITLTSSNGNILVEGKFLSANLRFSTYNDHRMAMAFAPLAMLCDEVLIEDPMVVNKSYPKFWEDLKTVGFEVEEVT